MSPSSQRSHLPTVEPHRGRRDLADPRTAEAALTPQRSARRGRRIAAAVLVGVAAGIAVLRAPRARREDRAADAARRRSPGASHRGPGIERTPRATGGPAPRRRNPGHRFLAVDAFAPVPRPPSSVPDGDRTVEVLAIHGIAVRVRELLEEADVDRDVVALEAVRILREDLDRRVTALLDAGCSWEDDEVLGEVEVELADVDRMLAGGVPAHAF